MGFAPEFYGTTTAMLRVPAWYLSVLLVSVLVLTVDFAIEHLRLTFAPNPVDIIIESDRGFAPLLLRDMAVATSGSGGREEGGGAGKGADAGGAGGGSLAEVFQRSASAAASAAQAEGGARSGDGPAEAALPPPARKELSANDIKWEMPQESA